jgi:hypothetical protein
MTGQAQPRLRRQYPPEMVALPAAGASPSTRIEVASVRRPPTLRVTTLVFGRDFKVKKISSVVIHHFTDR